MESAVVHCMEKPFDVYIGRRHPRFPDGSKWQNPFRIGKDGTREEVLQKFRRWLPDQKNLMASLDELYGKTLGCWCKSATNPQPCHGDIYLELLASRQKESVCDPAPEVKKKSHRISYGKKRLIRMPNGSTPHGLVKFIRDQGVSLAIKDKEVVCQIPDDLNPNPFNDVVRAKKNYLLAAIGGCEACKACGSSSGDNLVCAYHAFFLGKACSPTPIASAKKQCPLNSLQII